MYLLTRKAPTSGRAADDTPPLRPAHAVQLEVHDPPGAGGGDGVVGVDGVFEVVAFQQKMQDKVRIWALFQAVMRIDSAY